MVQLGLMEDFKRQVISSENAAASTKDPRILLGRTSLTSSEMRKVVMHTV